MCRYLAWLNNKLVSTEVDTEAAVTVLDENILQTDEQGARLLKLPKTKSMIRTRESRMMALAVGGKGPGLMWRTSLRLIRRNWGYMLWLEKADLQKQLTYVLQQFAEPFKE